MNFKDHSLMGSLTSGYMQVRDEKASNSAPPAGATTTVNIRTLNTIKANTITGASLASDTITLPAGSYYVRARAPTAGSGGNKLILLNVTDGTEQLLGASSSAYEAVLYGKFTIASTKNFKLGHYTTGAPNLGLVTNAGTRNEVYAEVEIWKES